jgi:adenosine deaminase
MALANEAYEAYKERCMLRRFYFFLLFCIAATTLSPVRGQAPVVASGAEARTTRVFNAAKSSPVALHAFLERMPKGADLHMHLSGAIYAETFLRDARADQLCVDPSALAFVRNASANPACPAGDVPVANAFIGNESAQKLYDALVDSFSMRSFVPSAGVSGHDQFFATFGRFGGMKDHTGEWLDEVATRAAAQNEQYLEVMQTPSFSHAREAGDRFGWPSSASGILPEDDVAGTTPAELSRLRDQLLAGGLREDIAIDRREFSDALAERRRIERCGEPRAALACAVGIRFIYQVLRQNSPQQVFAQTLLGFEVASVDPSVVGINFVQPEDAFLSMSEYRRQMRMLDYLHSLYPKVHLSLHAGELAPGMVPPEGLRFHIREAVDLGHAERIGHGADVLYEDDANALLRELADRHVMVEINLTSNDVILGVKAPFHPLPNYRAAHVPVALSTDDEGVSRIDLTHEYVRAALEFHLSYLDLKEMARTGIEHGFLPGESLWRKPDQHTAVVAACAGQSVGGEKPGAACANFLKSSEKAMQEWELEHRFMMFEATQH